MKVMVTGCAGFIGFFVAKRLCEEGFSVLGIDDLNDYYSVKLKMWRLDILKQYKNFSFLLRDISKAEIKSELKGEKFSVIYNLGARAGVRASIKNPKRYIDTNITGTLNILDICVMNGIEKFVLASTSSVYAGCKTPFSEDLNTDFVLSPYAASKRGAEILSHSYHHLYKIDITILRYFTVYGPFGRPDMSIFRFAKNIMEGKSIEIFGSGKQKRDFTYIDDIVDGTIKGSRKLGFEIINLGNNNPVELMYVVSLIENYFGEKAKIIFREGNPADLPETHAEISKAEKLLDWKPKTSIEEGIEKTCEWLSENRKIIETIDTQEKI